MQNIKELRTSLQENYENLKKSHNGTHQLVNSNNTARKIISTVVTELKYQNHMGVKKQIDFFRKQIIMHLTDEEKNK